MTRPTCPLWCSPTRCTVAHRLGEHRSEPAVIGGRVGAVVSLTRTAGRPTTFVEIRLSVPATGHDERAAASTALTSVARLVTALVEELQP